MREQTGGMRHWPMLRLVVAALIAMFLSVFATQMPAHAAGEAPIVNSVTPSSGYVSGGDSVTVSGQFFADGAVVYFGSQVVSATFVSDTTLTVTIPAAGHAESVDIIVKNPDLQTGVLASGFAYENYEPTITGVSPAFGPSNGGQPITITGSGFVAGDVKYKKVVEVGTAFVAIDSEGQTFSWGYGTNGVLGNGTATATVAKPTSISASGALAGKSVVDIVSGGSHVLALTSNGQVIGWGYNGNGQADGATAGIIATPTLISTGALTERHITQVAATGNSSVALDDNGRVYTWGYNNNGQLGDGTTLSKATPVYIGSMGALVGKHITQIAGGSVNVYAIDDTGTAYGWGHNQYGSVGNNATIATSPYAQSTPVPIHTAGVLAGKQIQKISGGGNFAVALATDGRLYSWGYNNFGQLGNNSSGTQSAPVAVYDSGQLAGKTIVGFDTKSSAAAVLAIASDGQLYGWGWGYSGVLGGGAATGANTTPLLINTSMITADGSSLAGAVPGGTHATAINSEGHLFTWGSNTYGELANGNAATAQSTPAQVLPVYAAAPNVYLGGAKIDYTRLVSSTEITGVTPSHIAGVVGASLELYDTQTATMDSAYEYIGPPTISTVLPSSGHIGGGDSIIITGAGFAPGAVVYIDGNQASNIIVVNETTITVTVPAALYAGAVDVVVKNTDLQTGTSAGGFTYSEAEPTVTSISPAIGPAAGGQHVTITGTGFVENDIKYKKVAMTSTAVMALDFKGKIYVWGSGQGLGNGVSGNQSISTPTDISDIGALAGKTVVDIVAGSSTMFALTSEGQVIGWGYNGSYGAVGVGSTVAYIDTPTFVSGGSLIGLKIVDIDAGQYFAVALDSAGHVHTWGYAAFGRLGNNNGTTNQTSPISISTYGVLATKTVSKVEAGFDRAYAIATDGTAATWGYNGTYTMLGSNSGSTDSQIPVNVYMGGVLSGKKIIDISPGMYSTLALADDGRLYSWGRATDGEIGNGSTTISYQAPVAVTMSGVLLGKTITSIDMSGRTAHVIDSDGVLYGWGYNSSSSLIGNEQTANVISPTVVSIPQATTDGARIIASGGDVTSNNSFIINSKHELYAWGFNGAGTLIRGVATNPLRTPTRVPPVTDTPLSFTLGGVNLTNVTMLSSTQATATTVAHSAGSVDLGVALYDGQNDVLTSAYEYMTQPAVVGIAPSTAYVSGGDTVVIGGADFRAGATVTVGGVSATVTNITSSEITIQTPAQPAGTYTIVVTDEFGQTSVLTSALTYVELPPMLSGIAPAIGPEDGGQRVSITGTGLVPGSTKYSKVSIGSFGAGIDERGHVYSWGYGQGLGNGVAGVQQLSTPVDISNMGALANKRVVDVSILDRHALALTSDGEVIGWGYNQYGGVGNGSTDTYIYSPVLVNSGDMAGKKIIAISAGYDFSIALDADGHVYTWGYNNYGQLGDGTIAYSRTPIDITQSGDLSGASIVKIAAGNYNSFAVDSAGLVYGWGNNQNGQVGNGLTASVAPYGQTTPSAVHASGGLAGKRVVDIAAGSNSALVITDEGSLYTWGVNSYGQLGNGTTTSSSIPVSVSASGALAGKTVSSISLRGYTALVLDSEGGVYGWGYNGYGQLTMGASTASVSSPIELDTSMASIGGAKIIEVGGNSSAIFVINSKHDPYLWGQNNLSYLGIGNNDSPIITPTKILQQITMPPSITLDGVELTDIEIISDTKALATTTSHSMGTVDLGIQLYDGQTDSLIGAYEYAARPDPLIVTPSIGYVTGGDTTVIGGNNFRAGASVKVGDTDATVTNVTNTAITIQTPANHAGNYDVTVTDEYGQSTTLSGAFTYIEWPPVISSVSPSQGPEDGGQAVTVTGQNFAGSEARYKKVIPGLGTTFALDEGGRVYAWGANNYGQLGNGTATGTATEPTYLSDKGALADKTIVDIASNGYTALALTSDGQIVGWGYNNYGQADGATTGTILTPKLVNTSMASGKIIAVAMTSGSGSSLMLDDTGRLYSWGNNTYGQLGNGTTANSTTPSYIGTSGVLNGVKVASISGGYFDFYAIDVNGKAYAWGHNQYGTVGNGSYTTGSPYSMATPVAISLPAAKKAVQLEGGYLYAIALMDDGSLYSWGYNGYYTLGNNTTTTSYSPTLVYTAGVLSGKTITSISAGQYTVHAMDDDGNLYAWGSNQNNAFGGSIIAGSSYVPYSIDPSRSMDQGASLRSVFDGGQQVNTAFVDATGKLYMRGYNTNGQLGRGVTDATVQANMMPVNDIFTTPPVVTLGGSTLINTKLVSGTTITGTTTPHAPGLVDADVTLYDNQTDVVADAYEYIARPTTSGVAPSTGYVTGGDTVTISGSDFQAGATVTVGGVAATVTNITPTTITVQTPANHAGVYDVAVTDTYGQTSNLAKVFTYVELPPVLSSVTPNAGPIEGGQLVTVTGENFVASDIVYSKVEMGDSAAVALDTNGHVYVWGYGSALGDGTAGTQTITEPRDISEVGALAGKTIVDVVAGYNHFLALASDGTLIGWGQNTYGAANGLNATAVYSPTTINTGALVGKTITAIDANYLYSMALDSNGNVYTWGYNGAGNLGNGTTTNSVSPINISTMGSLSGKTITQISAGYQTAFAIDSNGFAYGWGLNHYGSVGNNAVVPTSPYAQSTPVAVYAGGALSGKKILKIRGGIQAALVLADDGKLYAWGYGASGAMGNGTYTTAQAPVAVTMTGALSGVVISDIYAGGYTMRVLDESGNVYSWGNNYYGNLGDGTTSNNPTPLLTDMSVAESDGAYITGVGGGNNNGYVTNSRGELFTWGYNNYGQLINGTPSGTHGVIPARVVESLQTPPRVTIGGTPLIKTKLVSSTQISGITPAHAEGTVNVDAELYDGQIATLANSYQYILPPEAGSISPSTGFVSGGDSVVISGTDFSSGTIVTIGSESAVITNITSTAITIQTPANAAGVYDVVITDTLGQSSTLSGAFTYVELPPTLTSINPTRGPTAGGQAVTVTGTGFVKGKTKFTKVITGDLYSAAIDESGSVYTWGRGSYGVLGDNNTATHTVTMPTNISSRGDLASKTIVDISTSTYGSFILALTDEGQVIGWGYNSNGRLLGVATPANVATPTLINTGDMANKNITAISAGEAFSVALDSDGTVYTWGYNGSGQLGDGTVVSPKLPVNISSSGALAGKTITGIAAGGANGYAIDSDGKAYGWGHNAQGSVGNGTLIASAPYAQSTPAAISMNGALLGKRISDISGGYLFAIALTTDGDVYSWGYNAQGQLGDNTTSNRYSPVAVYSGGAISGKTIVAISSGASTSGVIDDSGAVYGWGNNQYGQLGNGATATTQAAPVFTDVTPITSGGSSVGSISAGGTSSSIIDNQGNIFSYGRNDYGQLGDGTTTSPVTSPVLVLPIYDTPPTLTIDGKALASVQLVSNTEVTGVTPTGSGAGLVHVAITNYDGQTDTLLNGYEYVDGPTISAITPASGSIAGGESAYVTGTNFTADTHVTIGGATASVSYISSTSLLILTPASANPGDYDVVVFDDYGQSNTLVAGYTYMLPSPTLSGITPQYAKMTGGDIITINGTGFVAKAGGGSWYDVIVDGNLASNVTYISSTQLQATVPGHTPGAVSVTVGGSYSGEVTLANALTYLPESYTFTNDARTLMANEPGEFTIEMRDENGDPITSTSDVTLNLTTDSASGYFARALSGTGSGWTYDSVVVPAGQSSATFFYRDLATGTPTITATDALSEFASQSMTINSQYKILVTGISNPTNVGVPSSVTVQAVDYTNVPQSDYTGTVSFTSDDGAAILPANYVFTAADHGRKTFTNGITFGTQGTWSVTATDMNESTVTGTQEGIVVGAPAAGTIAKLQFITPEQSFSLDDHSGIITIQTRDSIGTIIPVTSDTTIYVRSDSATGQYSLDGETNWTDAPLAVTIPANTSSINVYYRDTAAGTHTLTAAQNAGDDFGWQVASQEFIVGVGAPSQLGISTVTNAAAGQWIPVTVELQDASGNKVSAPADVTIEMTASQYGHYSLTADGSSPSAILTVNLIEGQRELTVYVQASAGDSLTLNASDVRTGETYDSAQATIQLAAGEATGLVFSSTPAQAVVHKASSISVSLKDQFGNIATAPADTDVTISSLDAPEGGVAQTTAGPWVGSQSKTIAEGTTTVAVYFFHTTVSAGAPVQATATGYEDGTASIPVIADVYSGKIRFAPSNETSITAGADTDYTVQLLDKWGNPALASSNINIGIGGLRTETSTWDGNATETLNGVGSSFTTNTGTGHTVTVPAGQSQVTATYNDTLAGVAQLNAVDQAQWTRSCKDIVVIDYTCHSGWNAWQNSSLTSLSVTVTPDAADHLSFATDQQVVTKNTPSEVITIESRDQYENPAPVAGNTTIDFSSSSATAEWSTSSNGTYGTDALVIPAGQSSVDLYYQDGTVSLPAGDTMTASDGGTLADGTQTIRIIEGFASQVIIDTQGVTTATAGTVVPATLETQTDDATEVVVLEDTTFALDTEDGEFSLTETPFTPVSTATVDAETSSTPLFYRSTVSGEKTLSATAESFSSETTTLSILAADFYKLGFSQTPTDDLVQAATPSEAFVVSAYDEFGNVAIASELGDVSVDLTNTEPTGTFATSQTGTWDVTTVTIPLGASTTQQFYYLVGEMDGVTGNLVDAGVLGNQTLTASTPDTLDGETVQTVVGDIAESVDFTSGPASVVAGIPSDEITVQLQKSDGSLAIATTDQTVQLSSVNLSNLTAFSGKNGNDVYSLTPGGAAITSVVIPAGSSTATIYVTAYTAENHRMQAAMTSYDYSGVSRGLRKGYEQLSVVAGDASGLAFTSAEQTIHPDKASAAIAITVIDDYENTAQNLEDRTINLSSSCVTGSFLSAPTGSTITSVPLATGNSTTYAYYIDTAASVDSCVLTAQAPGLADGTQNLVVREPVYRLGVSSAPQTIEAGQTSANIVVNTYDRFGNIVTAENPTSVGFTATGSDNVLTPSSRTIAAGGSSATFSFKHDRSLTEDTVYTVTATDRTGEALAATQDVTVVPGVVASFGLDKASYTFDAGEYGALFVRPLNAYGKVTYVTGSDATANLSTNDASGAFYSYNDSTYSQINSTVVPVNETQSDTLYYRQTTTTKPSSTSSLNYPDTLTASSAGVDDGTASVTIIARALAFSTGNFSAQSSSVTPMHITISGAIESDITVALGDSNSATGDFYSDEEATNVISSVDILAGETSSATFYYKQTAEVRSPSYLYLTADATTQPVSIYNTRVKSWYYTSNFSEILITSGPSTLEQGQTGTYTIQARDDLGNSVPFTKSKTTGICLYIDANIGTGTLTGQSVVSESISCTDANGATALYVGPQAMTATFTYKEVTTGTRQLSVATNSGATGGIRATKDVEITNAITTKTLFDKTKYTTIRGDIVTFDLSLANSYDFKVNSVGSKTATLTSSSASGRFYDSASGTWVSSLDVTFADGQTTVSGLQYKDATGAFGLQTLSASASGLATGTATVNLTTGLFGSLGFGASPTMLERQQEGEMTVSILDEFGNPTATRDSLCLYIQSDSDTGVITTDETEACPNVTVPGGATAYAIYVPANSTGATFTYTDTVAHTVTLTASTVAGGSGLVAEHAVDIIDGEIVGVSIASDQTQVDRGGIYAGVLTAQNAYGAAVVTDADIDVTLTSDLVTGEFTPGLVDSWTSSLVVTIPAGSSGVDVLFHDADSEYLGTVALTSTTAEYPETSQNIEIVAGDPVQLNFSTPTQTTTAYHPSDVMTVEVQNQYGYATTVSEDTRISVRTDSATGLFATSQLGPWLVASVTIPADQSEASFYYRDTEPGEYTLSAANILNPQPGDLVLSAAQAHTVELQVLDHFVVTNISTPQQAGTASSVVVFAMDSGNYVIPWYDGTITFSSSDTGAFIPGSSYTFVPETDQGIHTFTNSIAFKTTGLKSVSVTSRDGFAGTQFNIEVLAGNTNPVASVAFITPVSGSTSTRVNEVSEAFTAQLRDAAGVPTNAPAGGMPVRLTSSSPTGQFSTDGLSWSSSIVTTVEEGLSFTTEPLYYRDATSGEYTITASDWLEGSDNELIENDTAAITVNDMDLQIQQEIYSQQYDGNYIKNDRLFSRNNNGDILGYQRLTAQSLKSVSRDSLPSAWTIMTGTNIDTSYQGVSNLTHTGAHLSPRVGDSAITTSISAVSGSLVGAWNGLIPVSAWVASLDGNATEEATAFTIVATNGGSRADAPQTYLSAIQEDLSSATGSYSALDTTAQSTTTVASWSLSTLQSLGYATQTSAGLYAIQLPASVLETGAYTFVAELRSGDSILAQASLPLDVIAVADEENSTETPGVVTVETPSTATPGTNTEQPAGEDENDGGNGQPIVIPVGGNTDNNNGGGSVSSNWFKTLVSSPEMPIVVTTSTFAVIMAIAAVLLFQFLQEWRQARWLMAAIAKRRAAVVNKDQFLALASHHLRTPLSLLSSSLSLITTAQSEAVRRLGGLLQPNIASLSASAEAILAQLSSDKELAEISAPSKEKTKVRVYTRPIVWLPIVASIVITVAANWLAQSFGQQTIESQIIAQQVVLTLLASIILYSITRAVAASIRRSQELKEAEHRMQVLNNAKTAFASEVGDKLTTGVRVLKANVAYASTVEGNVSQKFLDEGTERLERLTERFATIKSVYDAVPHEQAIGVAAAIDLALVRVARAQDVSELHVEKKAIESLTLNEDPLLLSELLENALASMVREDPDGTVTITAKQDKDWTTLRIVGPALDDTPAKDIFSVYSRESEEDSGRLATDDDPSFTRLDLYLERIIVDTMMGAVSASQKDGKLTISLALPR